MKNLKLVGIIVLVAVIMLPMVGCKSVTTMKTVDSGTHYNIAMPAKNIEIIGLVRVEAKVDNKGNGEKVTYDALLKAAEAQGGNGIANVMIDRKVVATKSLFGGSSETTWYGTALAIKYTNENLGAGVPLSDNTDSLAPADGFSLFGKK